MHDRGLAAGDPRRLDPRLAEVERVGALLLGLGRGERVGAVDADDAGGTACAGGVHDLVDGVGRVHVLGLTADPVGFVADVVDGAVHHGFAEDGLDLIGQRHVLIEVDGLAAVILHQVQPVLVVVTDDDAGSAQEPGCCGAAATDGTGAGDVDGRAGLGPGLHEAVERGGQDVREQGEVTDLLHGLVLVREAEQLEVGVGDEQVLRLSALPITQVEPVSAAGRVGVHGLAHLGTTGATVAATAAGDVEGDRDQVALGEELDVGADLEDLAGHLVAHDHALGDWEGPAVDVQVGTADVGGDDLEDDSVRGAPAVRHLELREVEGLDAHVLDVLEHDGAVAACHDVLLQLGMAQSRKCHGHMDARRPRPRLSSSIGQKEPRPPPRCPPRLRP